ncbi:MAG: ArnT family glycosyltransferase [Anaerolineales bacterium]
MANLRLLLKTRSHLRTFLITLMVGTMFAVPRLINPNHYVMVDEPLWLYRSANFVNALKERDWKFTYQINHPGVTTMWVGAAGLIISHAEVFQEQNGQLNYRQYEEFLKKINVNPFDILVTDRILMALVTAITLTIAFVFAWDLLGLVPTLLGFGFLAFDPFHLALSRILHLDGLLSNFMFLALLALFHFWKKKRIASLLLSGTCSALSWLTKSPGLFLLPFIGSLIIMMIYWELKPQGRMGWQNFFVQLVKVFSIWGGSAVLISILLWPALLTDPIHVIHLVLLKGFEAAQEGHEQALFYKGVIYPTGRIGFRIWDFYPVNFLWRTTPVIMLGLISAVISGFNRKVNNDNRDIIKVMAGLWLFGLGFMLFMNLGDKKFDRYILPIFPPFDLLSGIGFAMLGKMTFRKRYGKYVITPALLLGLIGLQAYFSLSIFPYMVSYYNPLLGGPTQAVKIMDVGEGEGLELAAQYLNQKADVQNLQVFSWYATGCFSYFFDGITRQIRPMERQTTKRLQTLQKADYIVIYINQEQRGLGKLYLEYVKDFPIEKRIIINQIEYARIYKIH